MIEKIVVRGFKRFADHTFDFEPLTILSGLNGSGKTSLIHSVLLAHEASHASPGDPIPLNGPYGLELGCVEDILNWDCEAVGFDLQLSKGANHLDLKWSSEDAMYLIVDTGSECCMREEKPKIGEFIYLSAERHGPRLSQEACPLPPESIEIGFKGENCAQILEQKGNRPLDESRRHPTTELESAPFLKYEIEKWLSEIARPVEIDSERYPGSNLYCLKYRTPGDAWVKATNMGFGVSYSLPVILAGLIASEGGVIVVENPEAHLHPLGQSKMGSFLAWVASRGVQVILETHSDHIINGIRRAIAEHKYLPADKAVVHFFDSNDAVAKPLRFTELGGVTEWPEGFFDQYQIDTAALGRIRRRG
ncbi:DUF3696 domain-containing protein [Pseudomonas soli]|uniref:DUF3696 domain-containing protein n=1 Tax=Pseudomonas soli TaxID=1306993 RepID=UPI0039DF3984